MGPRIFIRGNHGIPVDTLTFDAVLQWGRGSSSAETSSASKGNADVMLLQWGRGSSSAETAESGAYGVAYVVLQWGRGSSSAETGRCSKTTIRPSGFNGAADLHPRKPA